MTSVTKSNKNNISSPNGNSLAVFVDAIDDKLKLKDINGKVQEASDYWNSSTVNVKLVSEPENLIIPYPAIPSVILTLIKI